MAGPSGAGAVAHYLKLTRSPARSAQRDIRAAHRRQARSEQPQRDELEPFACLWLCVGCGRLVEPTAGDPMRSTGERPSTSRCPSCGEVGLADLRHTPTVEALTELEAREQPSSGWRIAAQALLTAAAIAVVVTAALAIVRGEGGLREGLPALVFALGPTLLATAFVLAACWPDAVGRGSAQPPAHPRRWRLPVRPGRVRSRARGAKLVAAGPVAAAPEALLRAPLSGRPCVAYELAVRTDARPAAPLASWRLVEHDNVQLRVADRVVDAGAAVVERPRTWAWSGLVMSQPAGVRQALRIRGFLDVDQVHVYETAIELGDRCTLVDDRGLARLR